jgi:hypothetical protein
MKQLTALCLIAALMMAFSSCKKSSSDPEIPVVTPGSLIREIRVTDTLGNLLLVNTLSYDSANRLKSIASTQYMGDTVFYPYTLTYSPGRVVVKHIYPSLPQYRMLITYYLGATGLADSAVYSDYLGSNDSVIFSHSCVYDADGRLQAYIVNTQGTSGGTITYQWTGENVASIHSSQSSGGKFLFTYDATHYYSTGNGNGGVNFLGKSCGSPMVKARLENIAQDMANYSYQYDAQGRIIKMRHDGNSMIPCIDFYTVPMLLPHEILYYSYY